MWLIRSAISALFPRTEGCPGVAELELVPFLARYRREAPPHMWLGLVLGAVVFTITPILTVGWPLPSFWLPRATLDLHANRVASHRWYLLRQLIMIVKMAGALCWGQDARVRALHGVAAYEPDPGTWRRS
ncbi:MAG: hypothetical protein U1E65_22530 [Myxococcota bacterium]